MSLAAFKELLLSLQKQELVRITRLDLVGAAHQRGQTALLNRSLTERKGYGGFVTDYHLIAL